MRQLFRALSGSLVLITIATLLLAAPAAASASLMTFGFDGFLDCSPPICTNETVAVNERLVTAIFTIDTDAPDLNPDPQIGRYEFSGNGTGLSINLGGLTLFQSGFSVNVFNDQFGAFCGFGPGHQLRDMVTIVGSGGANNAIGIAVFFGMLGVTAFGLVLTPVFYVVIQKFVEARQNKKSVVSTNLIPAGCREA